MRLKTTRIFLIKWLIYRQAIGCGMDNASQLVLSHQQIYHAIFERRLYAENAVSASGKNIPADLENYVLKPLFSFAGQGVIIDVTKDDIENIKDPENWILQEKVNYEPVVQAPDGGVKVEIRLLYLWPDGDDKPTLAINLARLSRGKMIGVRYNKDFDWVGGTSSLSCESKTLY